ncbi:MAG: hypothetical protein ACJ8AT_18295 [Hyalangium sp.]|uniref:hypothetical protein n=1 Tax=Hyalangium sp. TaxID=2028555 RepID=UPI00389A2AB0
MLKTCRFLCLLGALLGLSGCPSPGCAVPVSSSSFQEASVIIVGEQVRLQVSPQTPATCEATEEVPTPESISVEISGPDNLPVDSQATLGSPTTDDATVRFTPTKQGRYHVFAAFDPVGGIQQFDLYSARDRSAEAPLQTLPQSCNALERTRRGGWLCDTDFLRDGAFVQRFTNARLAADGDVVWVVSPTQILRMVDTGTALQLSASRTNTVGQATFLLASAGELVILYGSAIERITFDGTQLNSTGLTSWVPSNMPINQQSLQGVLLRAGDQLATVTGGGSVNFGVPVIQVCPYQLQSGRFVRTSANCQLIATEVVGFEPNALWTGTRVSVLDTFNEVHRMEWTGTALVDQASLPLGESFKLILHKPEVRNTVIPVITPSFPSISTRSRATVPVYVPDRGILLEQLDTELPEPTASTTLLWGNTSSTSANLRVRTRPSTP